METSATPAHAEHLKAASPRSGRDTEAASDLFALGRAACALRAELFGRRGFFVRTRRLLPSGQWQGPRDAALSWVDADDLQALGGLTAALDHGAGVVITDDPHATARPLSTGTIATWWRVRFRRDDAPELRAQLYARAATLIEEEQARIGLEAILPWPEAEPMGLDTLTLFARLRAAATRPDPSGGRVGPHLLADFARLGPRLAQMCLTVGADGLFGPIVAERGLRLGDNANNPALTRREAATLLRGAGLLAHERVSAGACAFRLEEFEP